MKSEIQLSIKQRDIKKSVFQLLTGVTLGLFLQQTHAAEFKSQIKLDAGVGYDSNPAMSDNQKDPVWVYRLTPQLLLTVNDGINLWFLDAALQMEYPSNEEVIFQRNDPKLGFGWDRTYESGLYGVAAGYAESSGRITELKSTGKFEDTDNTQKVKTLSAKWQHNFSSRWSVLNEGRYTDTKYSAATSLQDYNLSEIRSKLTFANTEKLNTYAAIGYVHYSPDVLISDTDLFRLMLGADYQLNEGLNFGAQGTLYNVTGNHSDSGWEAGVKANYKLERTNYGAELSRSLAGGGLGGFQKTDSINVTWDFNISEVSRVGANYGLSKSKRDVSINVDKVDYQQIGAFYERNLSSSWKTRLSASHREIDTTNTHSMGNVIDVTLQYDIFSF